MKKSILLVAALAAALCVGAIAHAAGINPADAIQHAIASNPDLSIGLSGLGFLGNTNNWQDGRTLDLDPGATVPSGTGHLFGAGLFGVAAVDAVSGTKSAFVTWGVVTIAKTSALAIAVGDRLFWDPVNNVVNKTVTAQQVVGVAIEAAGNPSPNVKMKIGQYLPVAT